MTGSEAVYGQGMIASTLAVAEVASPTGLVSSPVSDGMDEQLSRPYSLRQSQPVGNGKRRIEDLRTERGSWVTWGSPTSRER